MHPTRTLQVPRRTDARTARRRAAASVLVVLAVALGLLLAPAAAPAGAEKEVEVCSLLDAEEIAEILDRPVTSSGDVGTLALSCAYDVGPGLGEPGGGLVVVQLHTGAAGKAIWAAAKSGERVGRHAWDPESEIATGRRRQKTVAASVSYTGGATAPEAALVKDQSLALLAAALRAV